MWPKVVDYVRWQRALRKAQAAGEQLPEMPDIAPLSINLDLTTACNYACDHCIDWDILNSKEKHEDDQLRASIERMAERGLRSVILIGGGEPTLYPGFVEFVAFLKQLDLSVSVVTNGSRGDRILQAAKHFTKGDWVRLSLDSGSNDVFQRMHHPSKKSLTLDEICSWIPKIKAANPDLQMGFSFVITWVGGSRGEVKIVENIHEMVMASKRASDAMFDYISFKPFLERQENGAEVMDPAKSEAELRAVVARQAKGVVAIGESAQLFLDMAEGLVPCAHARDMHEAVRLAGIAKTGPMMPLLSNIDDPAVCAKIEAAARDLFEANAAL